MSLNSNVRDFLNEKRFAVLATINEDGTPHLSVMWFALRDEMIVMNTTLSRVKGKNLQRDTRISICVEDGYRYVSIAGSAVLNDDQRVAHEDIRQLAIRYNGPEVGEKQALEFAQQSRVSFYLPISHVVTNGF